MIYLADQETLVIKETMREGYTSRVTGEGGAKIDDGGSEECGIRGDGVEKRSYKRVEIRVEEQTTDNAYFYTCEELGRQNGGYQEKKSRLELEVNEI
ncbi:hypothetical protein QYF36_000028 [Acer negundo]|nr:hypothetical protein QYF36_000028 [Acer negundo]